MILYNEIDPFAAQWLRNLSAAGHIAPGTVDERSIRELQPDDVRGLRAYGNALCAPQAIAFIRAALGAAW